MSDRTIARLTLAGMLGYMGVFILGVVSRILGWGL